MEPHRWAADRGWQTARGGCGFPGNPTSEGGPNVRRLLCASAFVALLSAFVPALAAEDTPKAAKTREALKTKISVSFKDTPLRDIIDEIKDQVQDKAKVKLSVLVDTKGGVSNNTKFTYKADDKSLEEILDEMLKKNDLGYIVISQRGNAYDGALRIVKGGARGYPEKKD
jgi:hypothetical protein